MTKTSDQTPAKRRPWMRRSVRWAFGLIGFGVLLFLITPSILSLGFLRSKVERVATEALGVPVTIEDHGLGWFSAAHVDGLVVEQPKGFVASRPAIALASAECDIDWVSLLGGTLKLETRVEGLDLTIVQHEDGRTNFDALAENLRGDQIQIESGEIDPDPDPEPEPERRSQPESEVETPTEDPILPHRFDLVVRRSSIEVRHETEGLLERLTNLELEVHKPADSTEVEVRLSADVERPTGEVGNLRLLARVDRGMASPMEVRVDCDDFDLGRYRPLLAVVLGPDQVRALEGVVTAHATVTGDPDSQIEVRGDVDIEAPRFAGELFQGMDIRAPRFELHPNFAARFGEDGRPIGLDVDGLKVDFGVLTLEGVPTVSQDGVALPGLKFGVDLAALAEFGGPIPDLLKGSGAKLAGEVRLPLGVELDFSDPFALTRVLQLNAELDVARLEVAEQVLDSLTASLAIANGRIELRGAKGGFDGGALQLGATVDATRPTEVPDIDLEFGLEGAQVVGSALEIVRFAAPMLAGAPIEEGLPFQSALDLAFTLEGPLMPSETESKLEWLSRLSGSGRFGLSEGRFTPAGPLTALTQVVGPDQRMFLAGVDGKPKGPQSIVFDGFEAGLSLAGGLLSADGMKLECGDRTIAFVGGTHLDGRLDYTLDVRDWLRGHKDGDKLLQLLGDTPLGARLEGTLDDPEFGLPSLDDLLKRAARQAIEKQGVDAIRKALGGNKEIDSVLKGIFGGGGGEKNKSVKPQKAAENLLRGILGGRRKNGGR